jgi:glycosyltransferase involved in cell wall biosynthesis
MKVAHYMPGYPGCDGTTSFARGLSRAMNRLYPGSCGIISQKAKASHPGDLVHVYPGSWGFPFRLPAQLKNDLQSGALALDGMVLHGTYNPPMVAMARFLRQIGMPYVFVPHDPYPPGLRHHHRWRKLAFWHLFEKPMIEKAVAVQLLDESHEKFLRDLGCRVPVFVQPNGCEQESLASLPEDLHEPGTRKVLRIQYLGRMDRNHKGLDLLIRAFAKVVGRHKVELWLIGNDWHDREYLEALSIKLGLSESVFFKGRRPETSIELQGDADLCVLSSRFDGFGLTVVEAMLARRPVLVSSEAGVAGHVDKAGGGWVVSPTVEAIATGLEEALSQKEEWSGIGRRGQDYILNNLTWEKVAKATHEDYRRVFLDSDFK